MPPPSGSHPNVIAAILPLIAMLFCLTKNCTAQEIVFPADSWKQSTPEAQDVHPGRLRKALDFLEEHSLHNGNREVVVIRNGYLIHAGEQADSVHNIWSCSKTFTSTVLGLLRDDGLVTLDEPAARHELLLEEDYPDVTFRHFATMTSGYSARGDSRWEDTDYAAKRSRAPGASYPTCRRTGSTMWS